MPPQPLGRKRVRALSHEKEAAPAAKVPEVEADEDLELDVSSDIKGILAALQHVRHKAQSDGQKKNHEILNGVSKEMQTMLDEAKNKAEQDRKSFFKGVAKACKEYETALKNEVNKFQTLYENFCKEKQSHLGAYNDIFAQFEETKAEMLKRYEQHRKKEKALLAELQKTCTDKIAAAEKAVKQKKQEEKSFSILKKSLGSFFESLSDGENLELEGL